MWKNRDMQMLIVSFGRNYVMLYVVHFDCLAWKAVIAAQILKGVLCTLFLYLMSVPLFNLRCKSAFALTQFNIRQMHFEQG